MEGTSLDLSIKISRSEIFGQKEANSILVRVSKLLRLSIIKNHVFVQVIALFAGINDIMRRWTINTVILPKACKEEEHYSLLSTFLVQKT